MIISNGVRIYVRERDRGTFIMKAVDSSPSGSTWRISSGPLGVRECSQIASVTAAEEIKSATRAMVVVGDCKLLPKSPYLVSVKVYVNRLESAVLAGTFRPISSQDAIDRRYN